MSLLAIVIAAVLASAPFRNATLQPSTAEREVRALEERERLAMLAEDTVALSVLWAPDYLVNTPQSNISENRSVVFALIAAGRIRHVRFERRIEAVRIDGDVAIVMGGETVVSRVESGVPPAAVERRFSHVWRRTSAGWRLVARHANRIPPS